MNQKIRNKTRRDKERKQSRWCRARTFTLERRRRDWGGGGGGEGRTEPKTGCWLQNVENVQVLPSAGFI